MHNISGVQEISDRLIEVLHYIMQGRMDPQPFEAVKRSMIVRKIPTGSTFGNTTKSYAQLKTSVLTVNAGNVAGCYYEQRPTRVLEAPEALQVYHNHALIFVIAHWQV